MQAATPARPPKTKYDYGAYLFLLPSILIYGFFVFYPILQTITFSLTDWNGITLPNFIGLDNYLQLLKDPVFLAALKNNAAFVFFYSVLSIALGLFLTVLLTRRPIRGLAFFRAGLFMPQVIAMVVVGMVWRWIYHPNFGPLNNFLRAIGLDSLARPWLGDFTFALPAVGIIGTWAQYGFCMVLFLAGVQTIGTSLYDAARIDGANEFQTFWTITLPGLRNQLLVALISTLIGAIRIFDLVFVTTRGGPGNQTMVAGFYLYRNAFSINKVGYGSAIAVVLTIIILVISVLILRGQRSQEEESFSG